MKHNSLSSAFICCNTAKTLISCTLWKHPSISLHQECVFYIVVSQYYKIKRTVSHSTCWSMCHSSLQIVIPLVHMLSNRCASELSIAKTDLLFKSDENVWLHITNCYHKMLDTLGNGKLDKFVQIQIY